MLTLLWSVKRLWSVHVVTLYDFDIFVLTIMLWQRFIISLLELGQNISIFVQKWTRYLVFRTKDFFYTFDIYCFKYNLKFYKIKLKTFATKLKTVLSLENNNKIARTRFPDMDVLLTVAGGKNSGWSRGPVECKTFSLWKRD